MVWTVRLFAYLKDGHGDAVQVEAEPTAGAVLAALGALGLPVGTCRLAVNQAFASPSLALAAGDELALIPPVSGG